MTRRAAMDVEAAIVHDPRMSGERSKAANPSSIADLRLARVLKAVRADPGRHWTVTDLAKLAGASRASLGRLFHAATGLAPKRWLAAHRLELGARLLEAGAPSLAELSVALGYRSVFSFSRAFKRQYGLSPAHYRRQGASTLRCAA